MLDRERHNAIFPCAYIWHRKKKKADVSEIWRVLHNVKWKSLKTTLLFLHYITLHCCFYIFLKVSCVCILHKCFWSWSCCIYLQCCFMRIVPQSSEYTGHFQFVLHVTLVLKIWYSRSVRWQENESMGIWQLFCTVSTLKMTLLHYWGWLTKAYFPRV